MGGGSGLSPRRAVVTGGAGFIGANLAERLVGEGWQVLVIDDLSTGRLSRLRTARRLGEVRFHQLAIGSEHLASAVAGFDPDCLFHLAAQTSVPASMSNPQRDAEINLVGTVNVLEAARLARVPRVVFTSTGGAIYGREAPIPTGEDAPTHPDSPYGLSKLAAEGYMRVWCERNDIGWVILRPANVYGPYQDTSGEGGVVATFARACLDRRPPTIFGSGEDTRDYVYVHDVVDALLRAATAEQTGTYNLGTGVETSTLRVFQEIAAQTRFRGEPRFGAPRPGDIPRSVLSSRRAFGALGWEARVTFEEGVRDTVRWLRRDA